MVTFGFTLRAPSVKLLMLRSTCGIGLAATNPMRSVRVDQARRVMPDRIFHFVDETEIDADILRMLAFFDRAAAVEELDVRIFARHVAWTNGS